MAFEYGELYRLRNGIIVRHIKSGSVFFYPVEVVYIPRSVVRSGMKCGQEICLLTSGPRSGDPLTWVGGTHGSEYDVVAIVTELGETTNQGDIQMDLTELEAKHKATANALAEMSAEIERLKAEKEGTLPWPTVVETGMVFEYLGGVVISSSMTGSRYIVSPEEQLISLTNGMRWCDERGFDGYEKYFRFLGHARDVLKRQRSGQELVGVRCWVPGYDEAESVVIQVYDAKRGYSWGNRRHWFSHATPADEVRINGNPA